MKKWILVLLLLLFSVSCRHSQNNVELQPEVITSIYPIYDLIRNIAGDSIPVHYMVPAGVNPHDYEVTPSEMQRVRSAAYFIAVHPEFDGWMRSLVHPGAHFLFLTGAERQHLKNHSPADENPHVWLNPAGVRLLIDQISDYMAEWYPEQTEAINQRSLHYKTRLDSLDQAVFHRFETIENRSFVQWHPAWNAFANSYGLDITGTISYGHGDKPSVKEFKDLIEMCRKKQVKVVVTGLNSQDALAETLARETGGTLVRLDTIGHPDDPDRDTVLKLINTNASMLAEALSKK